MNVYLPYFTYIDLILPSFTEFYRVLPSFTEFYRILPSFTEFFWQHRAVYSAVRGRGQGEGALAQDGDAGRRPARRELCRRLDAGVGPRPQRRRPGRLHHREGQLARQPAHRRGHPPPGGVHLLSSVSTSSVVNSQAL